MVKTLCSYLLKCELGVQKVNRSGYIIVMPAEPEEMPLFSSKENGNVHPPMQWVHITVEGEKQRPIGIKAEREWFRIISHPIFRSRQIDIIHHAGVCGILVGKIEVLARW